MRQEEDEGSAEDPARTGRSLNLVAIGASAGGIRALRSFFEEVPERTGIAFAVVMHLSPDYESKLASVLQPAVRIPVLQVRGRTRLEPDHVYVIPPDRNMEVSDGHLELSAFEEPRGRRSPIDTFFRTVAEIHPDGVGVLLSGSGTDGVAGLKAIKELGGIVMAQSPDEAEYDTMPQSAVDTGLVDFVLPARELGAKVVALRASGQAWTPPDDGETLDESDAHDLRRILAQLRSRTGHDFSGYRRTTVLRRVGRRIQVTASPGLRDYLNLLEESESEARALLKDLLISVTHFFRDPEAFERLERDVVPTLFRDVGGGEVRVWVAGCATGEEAYSVAMLLAEHAGTLQAPPDFQVFATDLDTDALSFAREGLYPDAVAADVGDERIGRFFTREVAHVRVTKEIRERILFSPHDILRDPPFSRLHLVTCRNLLIYLERGLQDRVLELFRYALRPGAFLFLGEAESVPDAIGFRTLDREHRIYRRATRPTEADHRLPEFPLEGSARPSGQAWPRGSSPQQAAADGELHRRALEAHAPPSVLVDGDHIIVHVSETANRYLEFPTGSPSASLLKSARPELRLELRSALHHALEHGTSARTPLVSVDLGGEPRWVQMHVAPAPVAEGSPMALVTFLEVGPAGGEEPAVQEGEGPADVRLDDVEVELATARSRLQDVMETSDRRQEELKASNEELQSINEEYRSALEELETSKEELQSMNEELKTVNDELKARLDELSQANDDLSNLMVATEIATLFLDRRLRIKRFTPALKKLFNILPTDEGRPLRHVTHQLRYPELTMDCEAVLESLQPVEREVGNGDGHSWLARITPYRTTGDEIRGVVCTFTDVTTVRRAQQHVRESEERFRALVDATAEIVWTTAPDGAAVDDCPAWRGFTGQTLDEWLGWGRLDAIHTDDRAGAEAAWRQAIADERVMEAEFHLRHAGSGGWRMMAVRAVAVRRPDGAVREWVGMSTDITPRKEAEEDLRRAKHAAEQAAEAKSQFLATMSHELRTPLTAVIGMCDLLETDLVGPMTERQKKRLGRIKSSAWHLVSIIEEVLTYSRAEAGRAEIRRAAVDLAEIAREVAAMVEFTARDKGLVLEVEGADRPVYLFSDGGKIRQIVTNLVGNAVKFTDDGAVGVRVSADGDHVELSVCDTGPGIPEVQRDAVFEPFVQVDSLPTREKRGSGLGLAVSRRLARLLGGDVQLDAQTGEGSTFTLRLPSNPDAAVVERGDAGPAGSG